MIRYRDWALIFSLMLVLSGCAWFGSKSKTPEKTTKEKTSSVNTTTTTENTAAKETAFPYGLEESEKSLIDSLRPSGQLSAEGKSFVLEELNYEVKRLAAELKHAQQQIQDMQSKSQLWLNPLSIYSKEIHLQNGTKIYGDIVDQDENVLQVKTLIGVLAINREQVVRVIDNIPTTPAPQLQPKAASTTTSQTVIQPTNLGATTQARQAPVSAAAPTTAPAANCVLSGPIQERMDRSNNRILYGVVKNIGSRRADFVKVNFVFRMNWNGDTRELTAFVKGSHQVFKTGVSTDTSLLPGASGEFELYVPRSFGHYIGYSYSISWEQYD